MNDKTINILKWSVIGFCVILLVTLTYYFAKGTVTIEYAANSEVGLKGIVSASIDKNKTKYDLPATIKMSFGRRSVVADNFNLEPVSQAFFIWPFQKKTIKLEIKKSEYYDNSAETKSKIPYIGVLPHYSNDFDITIKDGVQLINNTPTITALIMNLHLTMPTNMPDLQKEEYDQTLNSAKKWLKDNGVPDNMPLEIVSE